MKVIYLTSQDWFFWLHRRALATEVRERGGEVVVAAAPGAYRERIEAAGFRFHPVVLSRSLRNPLRNAAALAQLVRLYRRERPDIVHHLCLFPVLVGSLAARLAGRRLVVNAVTGLGHFFAEGTKVSPLFRRALEGVCRVSCRRKGTKVLFQNPDDRDLFVRRSLAKSSQCTLVPGCGVDTERFAPRPMPEKEPPGILLSSRMLWSKGVGVLMEAGAILRSRGVPHRIVLAGIPDPANPGSIPESQLRAWHAEGAAEWLGFQEDMPAVIAAADIVCLPSHYREGIPLALIEAASCGRPLVSTDTPGCREIVKDGENGFLVPPRDPRKLADALQRLVEDRDIRRRMGASSRERVLAGFSQETVIKKTLAVYRELGAGT